MRMILALALMLSLSFASPLTARSAQAASLKVMTYNVWGIPFAAKHQIQRLIRIGKTLAAMDADIVAIEEAWQGFMTPSGEKETLLYRSKFPYYTKGPGRAHFLGIDSGLMIMSRFPIVETDKEYYRYCGGIDCRARKGMTFARIAVPEIGEVDVYATHTNAGAFSRVRVTQAGELRDFVQRHSADHSRPIIIMGDMNASATSESLTQLARDLDLRDVHGEFAAQHSDLPQDELDGYSSNPKYNANVPSDSTPECIDHIFFREASGAPLPIRVASASLEFKQKAYLGKPLSDHFAVKGELRF